MQDDSTEVSVSICVLLPSSGSLWSESMCERESVRSLLNTSDESPVSSGVCKSSTDQENCSGGPAPNALKGARYSRVPPNLGPARQIYRLNLQASKSDSSGAKALLEGPRLRGQCISRLWLVLGDIGQTLQLQNSSSPGQTAPEAAKEDFVTSGSLSGSKGFIKCQWDAG